MSKYLAARVFALALLATVVYNEHQLVYSKLGGWYYFAVEFVIGGSIIAHGDSPVF